MNLVDVFGFSNEKCHFATTSFIVYIYGKHSEKCSLTDGGLTRSEDELQPLIVGSSSVLSREPRENMISCWRGAAHKSAARPKVATCLLSLQKGRFQPPVS
jgi:hypothetical protein